MNGNEEAAVLINDRWLERCVIITVRSSVKSSSTSHFLRQTVSENETFRLVQYSTHRLLRRRISVIAWSASFHLRKSLLRRPCLFELLIMTSELMTSQPRNVSNLVTTTKYAKSNRMGPSPKTMIEFGVRIKALQDVTVTKVHIVHKARPDNATHPACTAWAVF